MKPIIDCINRARYTPRFSTREMHGKDNVAEHSYTVTMLTLMLCKLLKGRGVEVDQGKALAFAVMHDFEETILGDVIAPTKEAVAEDYQFVASDKVHHVLFSLPSKERGSLYGNWRWAKHNSTESRLVIYADILATYLVTLRSHGYVLDLRERLAEAICSMLDKETSTPLFDSAKEVFIAIQQP